MGSAGGAAKVAWLTDDLGFDAAFDYREAPVPSSSRRTHRSTSTSTTSAATTSRPRMFHMADFGRIAMCGGIADYNATTPPPGPRYLMMAVTKRLQACEGFIVTDHSEVAGEFYRTVGPWLASGDIRYRETFVDGMDAGGRGVPRAFHRRQHRQDARAAVRPSAWPLDWAGRRAVRLVEHRVAEPASHRGGGARSAARHHVVRRGPRPGLRRGDVQVHDDHHVREHRRCDVRRPQARTGEPGPAQRRHDRPRPARSGRLPIETTPAPTC